MGQDCALSTSTVCISPHLNRAFSWSRPSGRFKNNRRESHNPGHLRPNASSRSIYTIVLAVQMLNLLWSSNKRPTGFDLSLQPLTSLYKPWTRCFLVGEYICAGSSTICAIYESSVLYSKARDPCRVWCCLHADVRFPNNAATRNVTADAVFNQRLYQHNGFTDRKPRRHRTSFSPAIRSGVFCILSSLARIAFETAHIESRLLKGSRERCSRLLCLSIWQRCISPCALAPWKTLVGRLSELEI